MPPVQIIGFPIPNWRHGGTLGKLRLYSSESWTDFDGVPHLSGIPGSLTDFYQEVIGAVGTPVSPPALPFTAFWPLSNTLDTVGNRALTNNNGVTFTAGKIGNAAHFVKANTQTLSGPIDSGIQWGAGQNWCISLWIKRTALVNEVFSQGLDGTSTGWYLQFSGNNQVQFFQVQNGDFTFYVQTAVNVVNDNNWHHVLCWFDKTDNKLRLRLDNGAVIVSATSRAMIASGSGNMSLGTSFGGDIDAVGIGKFAPTTAQQDYLWNGGAGVDFVPPVSAPVSPTLTIPDFLTQPTLNSPDNHIVRVTGVLFDEDDTVVEPYLFDNWIIPNTTPLSWLDLTAENSSPDAPLGDRFVTIDALLPLLNQISGSARKASAALVGVTALDVDPVDPQMPRAVAVNSPLIPPAYNWTGKVIYANSMPGFPDMGAQINAADALLGSTPGIIHYFGGGTSQTQIVLSEFHRLILGPGQYHFTHAGSPILMKSDTAVNGEGWSTVVEETTGPHDSDYNEFCVIANYRAYFLNGGVQQNMYVHDLQILGTRPNTYSTPQAISLGNCHGGTVENVFFNGTNSIGLAAGGSNSGGDDPLGLGRFSENIIFRKNLFKNVASQNIAFVNTKNGRIEDNIIIDPSKAGGPGVSPIDCEVNDFNADLMSDIVISGNMMDARNSAISPHGNFIVFQPATAALGFLICNNMMLSRMPTGYHTSSGILLNGGKQGIISDNLLIGCGQSGIALYGTQYVKVHGNMLIDTGTGGVPSVDLNGVQHMDFSGNSLYEVQNGNGQIDESGSCSNNSYHGNNLYGNAARILANSAGTVVAGNIINGVWIPGAGYSPPLVSRLRLGGGIYSFLSK
jgi:hypothetical protein